MTIWVTGELAGGAEFRSFPNKGYISLELAKQAMLDEVIEEYKSRSGWKQKGDRYYQTIDGEIVWPATVIFPIEIQNVN